MHNHRTQTQSLIAQILKRKAVFTPRDNIGVYAYKQKIKVIVEAGAVNAEKIRKISGGGEDHDSDKEEEEEEEEEHGEQKNVPIAQVLLEAVKIMNRKYVIK